MPKYPPIDSEQSSPLFVFARMTLMAPIGVSWSEEDVQAILTSPFTGSLNFNGQRFVTAGELSSAEAILGLDDETIGVELEYNITGMIPIASLS